MKPGRAVLALTFLSIGPVHFVARHFLSAIVPEYLPAHEELVVVSGVIASLEGVALLVPQARRPAAWAIVAWLLAVYPANIWMAQHPDRFRQIPTWALWVRLPFQLPMLWWALQYTKREDPALKQALLSD